MTDTEKLAAEIATKLVQHAEQNGKKLWVDGETHHAHHTFIQEFMEDFKSKAARRARIMENVFGALIISSILSASSVILLSLWKYIKEQLQ